MLTGIHKQIENTCHAGLADSYCLFSKLLPLIGSLQALLVFQRIDNAWEHFQVSSTRLSIRINPWDKNALQRWEHFFRTKLTNKINTKLWKHSADNQHKARFTFKRNLAPAFCTNFLVKMHYPMIDSMGFGNCTNISTCHH